jgi:DNA (cytosine-5)-methyltransferase 1
MIVLEGNGSRPSHSGDGYKKSDISYTLNATEKHGVCYSNNQVGGGVTTASKASFFMKPNSRDVAETLVSTDYKDPPIVSYMKKTER